MAASFSDHACKKMVDLYTNHSHEVASEIASVCFGLGGPPGVGKFYRSACVFPMVAILTASGGR